MKHSIEFPKEEGIVHCTYMFGLLMVPLRLLILLIINKSLNRKKPRSFLPPWPCGIETRSNSKNCRSLDTRSEIPSMTPCKRRTDSYQSFRFNTNIVKLTSSSRNAASRWSFSSASRSLQFKCNKMSWTSFNASCSGFWSGWSSSVCFISLENINS